MSWESELKLILEFLKVIITWPFVFALCFIYFISKFKQPLKDWFQALRIKLELKGITATLSSQRTDAFPGLEDKSEKLPIDSTPPKMETSDTQHWKINAYLWEYRYLNYFLMPLTKIVLNWLKDIKPVPYKFYDDYFMNVVLNPVERRAIITALQNHHLIKVDSDLLSITDKGKEYLDFMKKFPPTATVIPYTTN